MASLITGTFILQELGPPGAWCGKHRNSDFAELGAGSSFGSFYLLLLSPGFSQIRVTGVDLWWWDLAWGDRDFLIVSLDSQLQRLGQAREKDSRGKPGLGSDSGLFFQALKKGVQLAGLLWLCLWVCKWHRLQRALGLLHYRTEGMLILPFPVTLLEITVQDVYKGLGVGCLSQCYLRCWKKFKQLKCLALRKC